MDLTDKEFVPYSLESLESVPDAQSSPNSDLGASIAAPDAPNAPGLSSGQVPKPLPPKATPGGGILLGLTLAIGVLLLVDLSWGDRGWSWITLGQWLLGQPVDNAQELWIVQHLRLPRALVALGAGMALALAGTVTQGLTRNPLASPSVLGLTGGAALATVAIVVMAPGVPRSLLPWVAAAGSGLTAIALLTLTGWHNPAPRRLVLGGLALGLATAAGTQIFLTLGEVKAVGQALFWLTGSVYGRTGDQVAILGLWLGLGGLGLALYSRPLDLLALGEEVALGLGLRVGRARGVLLLLAVALTGAAVATAGSIGFVGLMAPHWVRRWGLSAHRELLPAAALVGGLLVLGADTMGRGLFAPLEVPCGVITAIVGGTYFLYLLTR